MIGFQHSYGCTSVAVVTTAGDEFEHAVRSKVEKFLRELDRIKEEQQRSDMNVSPVNALTAAPTWLLTCVFVWVRHWLDRARRSQMDKLKVSIVTAMIELLKLYEDNETKKLQVVRQRQFYKLLGECSTSLIRWVCTHAFVKGVALQFIAG